MTTQHPSARKLAQLADGRLGSSEGDEVSTHVNNCVLCHGYMTNIAATSAVQRSDHAPPTEPTRTWVESSTSEPEAGEIRRLAWDWTTELALIVRSAGDSVLVRPILRDGVTVEGISQRMECTVGKDPATLGVLTCAMWISTAALEAIVGKCLDDVLSPEEIVTHDELGDWISSNVDDDDPAVELVDVLIESFDALAAAASWAPSPGAQAPSAEQLMDAGLTPGRALQIVRGDAPTPAETEVLREHGLDVEDGLPDNVRSLLNRPKFKQQLRARAMQNEISEGVVRLAIAQQLRLPVAARTRDGRELPLERRLEELLR